MSDAPLHYWAACETAVFRANTKAKDGKSYYKFHGGEAILSGSVGDVVRFCAEPENIKRSWIVFRFVPLPSSMLDALWEIQHGGRRRDCAFDVRVHEKFSFPTVDRGTPMSQPAESVKVDAELITDDAKPEDPGTGTETG